jgi:outer membrane receptor protein involved in Fe transport
VSTLLLSVALAAAADPESLDRIRVTARAEVERDSRSEAVSRIDRDSVDVAGATHPSELLARVPGAWISRGSGQEHLTAIRSPVLTGPGACGAFLFLEDGVPMRPAGFCNVNQLFELNTEQAGRVEVLRGPGAAVHGSNALHGVLNVIPRRIEPGSERAAVVELGSERYRRARASLAEADAARGWRVDAYAVDAGSFREDEGFRQQKLSAQVAAFEAAGTPQLLLSAARLRQDTAGFIEGEDAYRDARRFQNANPEAFRHGEALRLQGRWRFALDGTRSLEIRPYTRHDRLRFIQHFILGKPLEENGSDSLGLQALLKAGDWRIGADIERAWGSVLEFQPEPLREGPPLQQAIRPEGRHYDYRVQADNLAVFAERELALGARTRLLLGARLESLGYDYANRMAAGNLREDGRPCPAAGGCLFNRPEDRRDRYSEPALQLALQHRLDAHWQMRGRIARAFRVPQAGELYRLQRGQDVADLRSEVLYGVELGLSGSGEDWRLALDAYAYDKRNVILRDAAGFNLSDGRTRHRGVEAEASVGLGAGWWLEGNAAWSVQRYAFDRAIAGGETIVHGNEIDTAPRRLAGLRINRLDPRWGRFELEWLHLGGYFLDAANTARYPGHDLVHLRWQRELSPSWRLSARLTNLADRRYAERADLGFGQFRYFPGAGRQLFVALEWRQDRSPSRTLRAF